HQGVEHYVTSFEFAGVGGEFGSIVPLPGVPSKVVRAGGWTLQRLGQETQPGLEFAALATRAAAAAKVLLETQIDALDVTVLKGGGTAVGNWAREHGFLLPPDAPEVLDFYANRSPIFMAVRFNGQRAKEQGISQGEGTPVHVVIPTTNPWVPLRILGLGAPAEAPVEADVYLLTDREPALLPAPIEAGGSNASLVDVVSEGSARPGLILERSEPASTALLSDLRSDKGMQWLPASGMWFTYMRVDANAGALKYDLAVDATGPGETSHVAARASPGAGPVPGWGNGVKGGTRLVLAIALIAAPAACRPATADEGVETVE